MKLKMVTWFTSCFASKEYFSEKRVQSQGKCVGISGSVLGYAVANPVGGRGFQVGR